MNASLKPMSFFAAIPIRLPFLPKATGYLTAELTMPFSYAHWLNWTYFGSF
jgi:hypothetical protein